MDKTKAQVWNTCGYVRLSRKDGDKEESNSVTGQKDLIRDYMARHPELLTWACFLASFFMVLMIPICFKLYYSITLLM